MASILNYKEFQKPVLKGLLEESLKDETQDFIHTYVGNEVTYDIRFAYDIIQRKQHIAAMIGLGAEKPVVDRHQSAQKMVEMAHFGLKDIITIEELYEIANARNNADKQNRINKLLNRADDLVQYLKLRKKVEKLKAVAFGKNSYDKNGVKIELDYGIPDDHKIALTTGNDWDELDRDVIGDLLEWDRKYRDSNGGKQADAILLTRSVYNKLTKNKNIIAEADRPVGSSRVSETQLNEVLASFGLPSIQIVDETSITVNDIYTGENETIEVFPENRVVFISSGVGNFVTGPNPDDDAMNPVATLEAYDERTPKRSIIEVAESGFVVLEKPSLLLHADVIGE